MDFEVRKLADAAGAEIIGLDLRRELPPATAAALRAAWVQHHVLVLRGQDLSMDDQRRFVACFGELQPPRSRADQRANADVMYVANVEVDGDKGDLPEGDMQFHADQCYYDTVAGGAVLYAIEVPKVGGNTMFGSTNRAYETLPAPVRARIDDLDVQFVYDYIDNAYHRAPVLRPGAPRAIHPAVIAHPTTGRPHLFVNRLMTESIVGLPRGESDALLDILFDHMEQPQMIYEHEWQPRDVVIWDNMATVHARRDFDPAERRLLRRMAIRGSRPVAYKKRAAVAAE